MEQIADVLDINIHNIQQISATILNPDIRLGILSLIPEFELIKAKLASGNSKNKVNFNLLQNGKSMDLDEEGM